MGVELGFTERSPFAQSQAAFLGPTRGRWRRHRVLHFVRWSVPREIRVHERYIGGSHVDRRRHGEVG